MTRALPSLLPALCALLMLLASGARADDGTAERERIRRERDATQARYLEAMAACGERFVVTACADAARAERRKSMEHLAREQAVLDDAQRKQRAAERLRHIQDKMGESDRRALDAAPRTTRPAPRAASAPVTRLITRPGHAAPPRIDGGARDAAVRRERQARRAQEAAEHRAKVERRIAERAARKAPAAPLPPPPAASR